jgi:hypothetical protein
MWLYQETPSAISFAVFANKLPAQTSIQQLTAVGRNVLGTHIAGQCFLRLPAFVLRLGLLPLQRFLASR